jgi:hypothetical protein
MSHHVRQFIAVISAFLAFSTECVCFKKGQPRKNSCADLTLVVISSLVALFA